MARAITSTPAALKARFIVCRNLITAYESVSRKYELNEFQNIDLINANKELKILKTQLLLRGIQEPDL